MRTGRPKLNRCPKCRQSITSEYFKRGKCPTCNPVRSLIRIKPLIPLSERFWAKVNKTPTCWLWTGGKASEGYGMIGIGSKTTSVHRVSWQLAFPQVPIPEGFVIMHICENRACVNPWHLALSTNKANMFHAKLNGRMLGGRRRGQI